MFTFDTLAGREPWVKITAHQAHVVSKDHFRNVAGDEPVTMLMSQGARLSQEIFQAEHLRVSASAWSKTGRFTEQERQMHADQDKATMSTLIGATVGEGKTGPWRIMDVKAAPENITSVEEAIAVVEAAVRDLAPWPEVVTVWDRDDYPRRLVGHGDDRYTLRLAERNKAEAIRIRLNMALARWALQIPDLLLVINGRAVTSIWDGTVRQAVDG